MKEGVPQGIVLGPILYLLHTCDILTMQHESLAIVFIGIEKDPVIATEKVQSASNRLPR